MFRTGAKPRPVLSAILFVVGASLLGTVTSQKLPVVINTWSGPFQNATQRGWEVLAGGGSNLDAVTLGAAVCEVTGCGGSVGFGGSPDESGETTLDAMVMDGDTIHAGGVAGLRRIKNAIGVARAVHDHTEHTLLSGDLATAFAVSNGFVEENLTTPTSAQEHAQWVAANCQPNYRVDVTPNASTSCGPYKPLPANKIKLLDPAAKREARSRLRFNIGDGNHDTIAMVAIDKTGSVASGTTTNGLRNKVPGRVGDSPIPGAGSYADSEVGGCGATGDGDVMVRFLPCYQTVENMRNGMTPKAAAEDAIRRIVRRHPNFQGALIAIDKFGNFDGAAHGWTFQYSVRNAGMTSVQVFTVQPILA